MPKKHPDDEADHNRYSEAIPFSTPIYEPPSLRSISEFGNPISDLSASFGIAGQNPLLNSINSITAPIDSMTHSLIGYPMTQLSAGYSESESDRESRESREEMEKSIRQFREELKSKTSTKEEMTRFFEAIEKSYQKEKESNTPEATLARLPTQVVELAKHCRAAELQKMEDYFSRSLFYWNCGFGHPVEQVKTLPQLKRIIEEQKEGVIKKCNKGHKSLLLVANEFLLTVSMEDFKGGKIRGGKLKTELRRD